jgi:formylmethanofuran dehydrogenase subunit D
MTFFVCSKQKDDAKASISFSGNQLEQFGFAIGSKVMVDISHGRIVITPVETTRDRLQEEAIERGA